MKRIAVFLLLGLVASGVNAGIASGADALINQIDPHANIGIEVLDLTTGATLYQRNVDRLFIPASNMKLFSNAAALMVLGPDYRFKNQLSMGHSEIKEGILKGSLYLRLPGDPSFNHKRLSALVHALKAWSVHRIDGNIIIDSAHAGIAPYPPGWMTTDLAYGYAAPLAPVMIDANRLMVRVNPADAPSKPAVIEIEDDNGGIDITNHVITRDSSAHCGIDFKMDNNNHLTITGCVGVGQWAVMQSLAIHDPLRYADGLIRKALKESDIVLNGQVLLGKTPAGTLVIARDRSKPIAQLMADTLKPSDNLYADSLFLHAADKLQGAPLNWAEAQTVIKQFLTQQTGISLSNAVLTDGSGLSRNDRLTTAQTIQLLRFLFDRFPLTYEYIAALPVSGRDGTLQKRFKKPAQQDRVRAKTGTMTGVVSLSGYLYTANGHTLAFAIFTNRVPGTPVAISSRYRSLVDSLGDYFLRQKPSSLPWATVFSGRSRLNYQLKPTQAERQKAEQSQWRRLESVVKAALKGQAVTVLFRDHELILQDNQPDAASVLRVMTRLNAQYRFSLALASSSAPLSFKNPLVIWEENNGLSSRRVWTVRDAS